MRSNRELGSENRRWGETLSSPVHTGEKDQGSIESRPTGSAHFLTFSLSHFLGLALLLLCGCEPSAPRSILKGDRLIRDGKYQLAVQELQNAVNLAPTNARAWNHFGLALHHNGQSREALKAYRQALALDRKMSVVHYNVGCLLLEQNDPAGAIDPLTSYTFLEPRSAAGWIKLGTAQLRARKLDAAEASFKRVLDLENRNAEPLNALGVIQAQRKRPIEALSWFSQALRRQAGYAPALLNSAVVIHQQLGKPDLALQKYRQYAGMQPPPPHRNEVAAIAQQLESSLKPRPAPAPVVANAVSPATSAPPTLRTAQVVTVATTNIARTNTPALAPERSAPQVAVASNAPQVQARTQTVTSALAIVPPKKPELEVIRVADDLEVNTPRDVSLPPRPTARQEVRAQPDRPSFIDRVNPFTNKQTSIRTEVPPEPVQRYAYLSPPPGRAGDRAAASRQLAEGLKLHQARRAAQAIVYYQRAAELDPSYFEARYNLGLALYDTGNWKKALESFEHALALRSDSTQARYNFALALKQADYPRDAADQLERILRAVPGDARAHLSLGNLYAQKLNQPQLARSHYTKVLQLNPSHPQAGQVRFWLAANP